MYSNAIAMHKAIISLLITSSHIDSAGMYGPFLASSPPSPLFKNPLFPEIEDYPTRSNIKNHPTFS